MLPQDEILLGNAADVLTTLPSSSVDMCLTSPPYFGLKDYGIAGQIGFQQTVEDYVGALTTVFYEVHRVLKPQGILWLNLGDSYASTHHANVKPKDLLGIPWLVAFSLREVGWFLRQDIIWSKGNAMLEAVKDRCVRGHEYLFLLAKSRRYFFDHAAIREPCSEKSLLDYQHRRTLTNKGGGKGSRPDLARSRAEYYTADGLRNRRDVWQINTKPYRGAHFAVFPEALAELCIMAGCPESGIVLDPFMGAGTTAVVAQRLRRHFIGIELNPSYIDLAHQRLQKEDRS